jgi:hypothetical protein
MLLKSLCCADKVNNRIIEILLYEEKKNSGDAGNRTRVQTSNQNTFYMLIFRLVFDLKLTENSPL